jgi:hypothetical protein
MDLPEIWPDDCRSAVSITFDDGRDSQLTRAVPHMNNRGLRGTFYVPMRGDNYLETYAPWRAVADQGHEIGNHTKSHICSRNFSFRPDGTGLEEMTLDGIEADIVDAEARLRELIPQQTERTFAYPCYQTFVGEGLTRQSYVPIVARHFAAGRSTGEFGFFNNPLKIDLHCLNCVSYGIVDALTIIGLVERCFQRGHWIIVTYHGIDTVKAERDFIELMDHLVERRDRIWTAPVVEIAKHLKQIRDGG